MGLVEKMIVISKAYGRNVKLFKKMHQEPTIVPVDEVERQVNEQVNRQ